jgi:hypothetical protein
MYFYIATMRVLLKTKQCFNSCETVNCGSNTHEVKKLFVPKLGFRQ